MLNVMTFATKGISTGTTSLVPCIDGHSLSALVEEFEVRNGYNDPAGGYGGIVPAYYRLGPLDTYFLGLEAPVEGAEQGSIYTLFCECGEPGCWPLIAHVTIRSNVVVWNRFAQPHRPARDYAGLGPFQFDRVQYDAAVAQATSLGGLD